MMDGVQGDGWSELEWGVLETLDSQHLGRFLAELDLIHATAPLVRGQERAHRDRVGQGTPRGILAGGERRHRGIKPVARVARARCRSR